MDFHQQEDTELSALDQAVAALKADFDGQQFEQLLRQFSPLIRSCYLMSKSAYLDYADFQQEARVTLWKAIFTYNGGIPFKSYFKIVLIRHFSHLYRYESAYKRVQSSDCVSLDVDDYVREQLEAHFDPLSPLAQGHDVAPEDWCLAREVSDGYFSSLSDWEKEALLACLDGMSVEEMSQVKGKSQRSCQSALSRCRKKLEDFCKRLDK